MEFIESRNILLAFWGMARPTQLLAVFILYTTGVIIGIENGFSHSWYQFIFGLIPLLIAGVSIHYSNEYADVETDKLTERTPFSGGSGVLAKGLVSHRVAWWGMWTSLFITLALSAFFVATARLNIIAFTILLIGLFGGWMYSLPPLKLGWRGWGELDNALLGGLLLPLYGYAVLSNTISLEFAMMFLPFTGLVFINLLATTWADRQADQMVGKNTLATRWSIPALRRLYAFVSLMSYVLLLIFADRIIPIPIVIGGLLISPLIIWGYARYTKIHSPHPTVYAMIAMMLIYFGGWLIQLIWV